MTTLALIGAGKWGQNYLMTAASLKDVEIKYICSQSQKTLTLLPDIYIKTSSVKDLLENKNIDGFIVATPAITHFTVAKQILSSGQNLLIEKPFTTNYDQALNLQKIWQTKKPKVLVGHLYLYNSAYQKFKELFKNIKAIKLIRFEGLSSPVRYDVSVIWDWGPHPISLLLDLIKQPVVTLRATGLITKSGGRLFDTVEASLKFANDTKASINISWLGIDKVRKLTVEGEDEVVEFDDTNTPNQKVLLYKPNQPIQYPRYKLGSALTEELREFVMAVKGNKKIISNVTMGVEVVKILSAVEKSAKSGGNLIKLS